MATPESDQSEPAQEAKVPAFSPAGAHEVESEGHQAGCLAAWKALDTENKTPIIVAIIGLVGAFIVSIIGFTETWVTRPTPVPPSPTATVTVTSTVTPTPQPAILIATPQDGSDVTHSVAVRGALGEKLCAGCQVYIIVHPVSNTTWYGQKEAALLEDDLHFVLEDVQLGRNLPDDNCKSFEIWTVISPFNLRGKTWNREEWDQLKAIRSTMVTVTRKGVCP
jgi:hypothetical protein